MGIDHIQNNHNNVAPTATENMADQFDAQYSVAYTNAVGTSPKEFMGFGIVQGTDFGNFSLLYVPNMGDAGNRDSRQTLDKSGRESAYEVGFRGNLGVKGLDVKAFKVTERDAAGSAALQQIEGTSLGLGYSFPAGFTVGADLQKTNKVTTQVNEFKTKQLGIAYAATKDLSFSVNRAKTEQTLTSAPLDEKWMQYAVGYNLGPVAAGLSYVKVENVGGNSTIGDTKLAKFMLSTRF